jgi:hypothetical protein
MSLDDTKYDSHEEEPAGEDVGACRGSTASAFIKGLIVGFGLAAVASVVFNIFNEQRASRRKSFSQESRIKDQDESGGVLGDLSYIIDESTSAFGDAVRTLDKTFESGRKAIESVQDVIDKIRE